MVRAKVIPDSRRDAVLELGPDRFEIHVRAPAREGRANQAVLDLLARHLGKETKRLRILRGATRPNKIIQVF